MAKKKRYRGHYCKICRRILPNEKFSGKGHSKKICKKCSKIPLEKRNEIMDVNRIYSLYKYSNLSKSNRLMLEKYLSNQSEKVRLAAKEMLDEFKTERNKEHEELYEEIEEMVPGSNESLKDNKNCFGDIKKLDEMDDIKLPF